MIREVTKEEIKTVVFNSNGDKAPGPDGFNANFFKRFWPIGDDVTSVVLEFFQNEKLLREINHKFLTLVPKCEGASSLQQYRPIACCSLVYKFITKILSERLGAVIDHLISPNQLVFIKGRHINEASLLAHELVRNFSNIMGSRACIKVDLRKAFDSLNRDFILEMLRAMNFLELWINGFKSALHPLLFQSSSMAHRQVSYREIGDSAGLPFIPSSVCHRHGNFIHRNGHCDGKKSDSAPKKSSSASIPLPFRRRRSHFLQR